MLKCCGRTFSAARKIVLPENDKMYRCLEFGYCPNCRTTVSRLVEQDENYEVSVREMRGIKALRAYEKALARQNAEKSRFGSASNQNYYYGFYKKSRQKDENNLPVYFEYRVNFNNVAEKIGKITTKCIKI
ncbi:MAG: hypothetical protein ACI4CY_03740 [Candidatus Gastranaerophilaceae bacterium]